MPHFRFLYFLLSKRFVLGLQQATHSFQDPMDLWLESHINHSVCFVQNYVVTLIEKKNRS